MPLPGTKSWQADLIAMTTRSDWDLDNGGLIRWSDGTLWSYEGESPASSAYDWYYPQWGINIQELKPGSPVWERITPDVWGTAYYDHPPGYERWPMAWPQLLADGPYQPYEASLEGRLNVSQIGLAARPKFIHVQDGDEVWVYQRYTDDDTGSYGPFLLNKETRSWKRFVDTPESMEKWARLVSNIVLYGDYMWFLLYPRNTCSGYDGFGLSWARALRSDPSQIEEIHKWAEPATYPYATGGWLRNIDTSNITLPDWMDDKQYMSRVHTDRTIAIDDNGFVWVSEELEIRDVRSSSTPTFSDYDGTNYNYNVVWSAWRRFALDDPTYTLESMYFSHNQGWFGRVGIGDAGTWFMRSDGIGHTWEHPSNEGGWIGEVDPDRSRPDVDGVGLDFGPASTCFFRDGWLYFFLRGAWDGAVPQGTGQMLCRLRTSDLKEKTRHYRLDPLYEIITNGDVPFSGDAGHMTRSGTWISMRMGSEPILPHPDSGPMTFDVDGSILYKGMMFNPLNDAEGFGTRCIVRLREPKNSNINVTLTFEGTSLTGYGNVRDIASSKEDIIVELSG